MQVHPLVVILQSGQDGYRALVNKVKLMIRRLVPVDLANWVSTRQMDVSASHVVLGHSVRTCLFQIACYVMKALGRVNGELPVARIVLLVPEEVQVIRVVKLAHRGISQLHLDKQPAIVVQKALGLMPLVQKHVPFAHLT